MRMGESNEKEDEKQWEWGKMVIGGWSLNADILEFEDVLKSLTKQDILIGQIANQDLRDQVIAI